MSSARQKNRGVKGLDLDKFLDNRLKEEQARAAKEKSTGAAKEKTTSTPDCPTTSKSSSADGKD